LTDNPGFAASPEKAGKHRRENRDDTAGVLPVTASPASSADHLLPHGAAPETPQSRPEEKVGLFGVHKRLDAVLADNRDLAQARDELARDNEHLRQQVTALMGMDVAARAAEADRAQTQLQTQVAAVQAQLAQGEQQIAQARAHLQAVQAETAQAVRVLETAQAQIVQTDEVAALQEVGVYEYRHPLQDAVAYKSRLKDNKDQAKAKVRAGTAVHSATSWTVNGSAQKGTAMVREVSKLMLRAYNAEADNCVRTLRPHTLQTTMTRLGKAGDTIARLGKTMNIEIDASYHRLRLLELELTADYLVKQDEEKERIRAERERQREDEAARREFEREKTRLMKEQAQYSIAMAQLRAAGDVSGVAELQAHLDQVNSSIQDVERRAANTRAGHVYIISNVGSFGEDMIKIGMTRRLDPNDRIRELGDASVPFKFDVHALIFSDDAVGLETRLHQSLEHCRVNQVNRRREFFRIRPVDVLPLVKQAAGSHLMEFTELAEALEWRASTTTK
jgi:multidrug efflux pump subunit AcrA (membrane-fusion protein)